MGMLGLMPGWIASRRGGECRGIGGAWIFGEGRVAHACGRDLRTEQNCCGAADFYTVVLPDEGFGGAGDCGGEELCAGQGKYHPHYSGQSANGIFELDGKHSRLDDFAAALVGTSNTGLVLQGTWARDGGAARSGRLPDVRVREFGAGSGCFGYLV